MLSLLKVFLHNRVIGIVSFFNEGTNPNFKYFCEHFLHLFLTLVTAIVFTRNGQISTVVHWRHSDNYGCEKYTGCLWTSWRQRPSDYGSGQQAWVDLSRWHVNQAENCMWLICVPLAVCVCVCGWNVSVRLPSTVLHSVGFCLCSLWWCCKWKD